jgi:hypothetical protein
MDNTRTFLSVKNGKPYKSHHIDILFMKMFDIVINDSGVITVDGKPDTISYNMEEWTKTEAIRDFCAHRCAKFTGSELYIKIN